MQKINRRNVETFSLSFLDIIACGFGAIVLLLLIAKVGNPTSTVEISKDDLLNQLFDLQDQKKDLDIELLSLRNNQISINNIYDSERQNQNTQKQRLEVIKQNQTITESLKERLYLAQQSLTEEMKRILDGQVRDVEVGGIPVDSEYIIFVIDNSGSMYSVWDELLEEMDIIHSTTQHEGSQYYELHNPNEHHHHVVCTECMLTECVPCSINIPKVKNFSNIHHSFTLTGLCIRCS